MQVSTDGKGLWADNVCIQRLRRSLKWEAMRPYKLTDGLDARQMTGVWMPFHNACWPHSSLGGGTPGQLLKGRICPREGGVRKVLTCPLQRAMVNYDRGRFQSQDWALFRPSTCNRNRLHHST